MNKTTRTQTYRNGLPPQNDAGRSPRRLTRLLPIIAKPTPWLARWEREFMGRWVRAKDGSYLPAPGWAPKGVT